MIGKSLVLLATLLLALGACDGAVTLQRCLQSTKKVLPSPFTLPTLRVHWGEWTTMQLSTSVAAILLSEKMGFDVQLVDGKTSKQAYEDLAEGEIHLSFEAWPKSNQAEFDRFTKQFEPAEEPGQVHSYPYTTLFGRSGLFETCSRHASGGSGCMDTSMTQSKTLLKDVLADAKGRSHFSFDVSSTAAARSFPDWVPAHCQGGNCTVPILHIEPTGYDEGLVEDLVRRLKIPAKVVYLGMDEHADAVWSAHTQRAGALVYSYTPNALMHGVSVKDLQRAKIDPELDFMTQRLQKLAWPGLKDVQGGDALAFIRDFNLSPDDYEELARLFDTLQDPQEAACIWVKQHESEWSSLIKFPERAKAAFFCLRDEHGLCDSEYLVGWAVFFLQIVICIALFACSIRLRRPPRPEDEALLRHRIIEAINGQSPDGSVRRVGSLSRWLLDRAGNYKMLHSFNVATFRSVPTSLTHKRSFENFVRSNLDPALVQPPDSACSDRWVAELKRNSLFPFLFFSTADGMMPYLVLSVSFGFFSGSLASLFWLRTHWDTYKNDPIAFANGVPRVGEGSELNAIQHTSDIFTSLIDAFKFFPSFLLLGFVGYAVNRWRGFQDAGYNILGAIHSTACVVGGSVINPEDLATQQLLYRVYRYLTVAHMLNFKGCNCWFNALQMQDLVSLGLLTEDELEMLEKPDMNNKRELLVVWIAREMYYGVKHGLLQHKIKCTLATSIRGSIGGFQACFGIGQPNLWVALMKFVCDLLILMFVLGTPWQSFMYELPTKSFQVFVVAFTIIQTVPWLCASALVSTLNNPYEGRNDIFNCDANITFAEKVAFNNLRGALNFPNQDSFSADDRPAGAYMSRTGTIVAPAAPNSVNLKVIQENEIRRREVQGSHSASHAPSSPFRTEPSSNVNFGVHGSPYNRARDFTDGIA